MELGHFVTVLRGQCWHRDIFQFTIIIIATAGL